MKKFIINLMMPILIVAVLCFQPFLALASGDISTEINDCMIEK